MDLFRFCPLTRISFLIKEGVLKSKCLNVLIVSVLGIIALPCVSFSFQQHSIGVDFIRLFDRSQYKGMLNLFYQVSISDGGAVTTGIARGMMPLYSIWGINTILTVILKGRLPVEGS